MTFGLKVTLESSFLFVKIIYVKEHRLVYSLELNVLLEVKIFISVFTAIENVLTRFEHLSGE
jgi:hypothetical protein